MHAHTLHVRTEQVSLAAAMASARCVPAMQVFRNLDEIYAGSCDGMTYEQIADLFPAESAERKKAKFA